MENTFDGLIRRMGTAKERISEFEDIWIETSKTEKQRKKGLKIWNIKSTGLWDNYYTKGITYTWWEYQKEKTKRNRRNIWNNNEWKFPQINIWCQITDQGSSENTKKGKWKKKKRTRLTTFKPKTKIKKKSWKNPDKEHFTYRKAEIGITTDFSSKPYKQEESGIK